MNRHHLRALPALAAVLFVRIATAVPEYVPIQEKAQGRSLSGAHVLNDSLYSNPAGASFTNTYSLDASMSFPKSFGVSVLDTRTSQIGGGLGYFRRPFDNAGNMLQGGKLVLTTRLSQTIGVGIAGKILFGPQSLGTEAKLTDMDAGILANFEVVQVGFTMRNIFGGKQSLDQQREATLGARINWDNTLFFSASASAKQGLRPYQYGFGAEYVSPYFFSLKGGYWFQPGGLSAWTAGASVISAKVSLHYAIEFPSQPGVGAEHQLGVTLLL